MKRLLLLTFVGFAVAASGQMSQSFSVEVGGNSYISLTHNTPVNFGGSVFVFDQMGKFAVGLGVSPSTNNFTTYYTKANGSSEEASRNFTSTIWYYHLQFLFGVKENKPWNINFTSGVSLAFVSKEKFETYSSNGLLVSDTTHLESTNNYNYLNLGVNVIRNFSPQWRVVFRPVVMGTLATTPHPEPTKFGYPNVDAFPIDQLRLNLFLGVNYVFKKHTIPPKEKNGGNKLE